MNEDTNQHTGTEQNGTNGTQERYTGTRNTRRIGKHHIMVTRLWMGSWSFLCPVVRIVLSLFHTHTVMICWQIVDMWTTDVQQVTQNPLQELELDNSLSSPEFRDTGDQSDSTPSGSSRSSPSVFFLMVTLDVGWNFSVPPGSVPPFLAGTQTLRWRLKGLCQTTRTWSLTMSRSPSLNPTRTLTKFLCHVTRRVSVFFYFYILSSTLFLYFIFIFFLFLLFRTSADR